MTDTLPTCVVTATLRTPDGAPLHPAKLVFRLTSLDHDQDTAAIVLPPPITAETNDEGAVSIALWPNAAGRAGTRYQVSIIHRGRPHATFFVTVPDALAADLSAISEAVPPATMDDATAAAIAAQQAAAEARTDRLAVAEDRETVGEDRSAVADDREAVAGDRHQTSLDAAATAADRVQTGMDRAAVNAALASIPGLADIGTVKSVEISPPAGLEVSGGPITTSGTIALTWAADYQPLTAAMVAEMGETRSLVNTLMTAPLGPPFNLLKDAGRFSGSPEPQGAQTTGFVAPAYVIATNGATISAGPRFITNNNDYGGTSGTLDADVKALVDKWRDASFRRYGVEFYLLDVLAGSGTATARTIGGHHHRRCAMRSIC